MNKIFDVEEVRYALPSSFYEKIKPQKEDKKKSKVSKVPKKETDKPLKKEKTKIYEV